MVGQYLVLYYCKYFLSRFIFEKLDKYFEFIQKYEYLWKVFFIVVLGLAAMLFSKVYVFQTHP